MMTLMGWHVRLVGLWWALQVNQQWQSGGDQDQLRQSNFLLYTKRE